MLGRVDVLEAMEFVGELKRVALKPDPFTFNALIKGYCRDGKLEEAKKIYRVLEENGCCAPNLWTVKTLMPLFLEAAELDFAVRLCNGSIDSGCYLDVELLQGFVDGLVGGSRMEKAERLVKHVRSKSYYGGKSLRMALPCLAVYVTSILPLL